MLSKVHDGALSIDLLLGHNRANHRAYDTGLSEVRGVDHLRNGADDDSNRHYVVVEVDAATSGLSRDELVGVLRLENIEARRYFHPGCHRQQPYRTTHPGVGADLPVTERLSDRVMVLPTGLAVDPGMVDRVCGLIATAIASAPEVRQCLRSVDEDQLRAFGR